MPTAFKYLRDALRTHISLLPLAPPILLANIRWKKVPTARDTEPLPRIDLVAGEDWLEPFTPDDSLAWVGHYIVHVLYIVEADTKRLFNDVFEDNRQILKKAMMNIPAIQNRLDLLAGAGVVTLDDVTVSRRKIHNVASLKLDYDIHPLTFEYTLQETRTGVV